MNEASLKIIRNNFKSLSCGMVIQLGVRYLYHMPKHVNSTNHSIMYHTYSVIDKPITCIFLGSIKSNDINAPITIFYNDVAYIYLSSVYSFEVIK